MIRASAAESVRAGPSLQPVPLGRGSASTWKLPSRSSRSRSIAAPAGEVGPPRTDRAERHRAVEEGVRLGHDLPVLDRARAVGSVGHVLELEPSVVRSAQLEHLLHDGLPALGEQARLDHRLAVGPGGATQALELGPLVRSPCARGVQERDVILDDIEVPSGSLTGDAGRKEAVQEVCDPRFRGRRPLLERRERPPSGHDPDPRRTLDAGLGHIDAHRLVPDPVDRRGTPAGPGIVGVQGARPARCAPDERGAHQPARRVPPNVWVLDERLPAELLTEEPAHDLRVVVSARTGSQQLWIDLPGVVGIPLVRQPLRLSDLLRCRLGPRAGHRSGARIAHRFEPQPDVPGGVEEAVDRGFVDEREVAELLLERAVQAVGFTPVIAGEIGGGDDEFRSAPDLQPPSWSRERRSTQERIRRATRHRWRHLRRLRRSSSPGSRRHRS